MPPESLGRFDLITAFEVFEHVPDVEPAAIDSQGGPGGPRRRNKRFNVLIAVEDSASSL